MEVDSFAALAIRVLIAIILLALICGLPSLVIYTAEEGRETKDALTTQECEEVTVNNSKSTIVVRDNDVISGNTIVINIDSKPVTYCSLILFITILVIRLRSKIRCRKRNVDKVESSDM